MVDEIHWIYKFPGVQFGLDPVTAGDTIHLNQKKNYHPFVVRTKSIHQNKKKNKNKRKGNIPLRKTHKKKYSDRKKKNKHSFLSVKTYINLSWHLPFPPDTLLGRQGSDLEKIRRDRWDLSSYPSQVCWSIIKKKVTGNSG